MHKAPRRLQINGRAPWASPLARWPPSGSRSPRGRRRPGFQTGGPNARPGGSRLQAPQPLIGPSRTLGGPQLSRPTRPTQKDRRRTIPSKEETSQRPKQKHCLHGRVKPRSAENGGAQDPTLHALLLLGTGRAYPAYVPGSLPENPSLTCATYFQSANEAPAKLVETPQSSNEHRNADQGQIQNPKPDARVTDTRGRTHTHIDFA